MMREWGCLWVLFGLQSTMLPVETPGKMHFGPFLLLLFDLVRQRIKWLKASTRWSLKWKRKEKAPGTVSEFESSAFLTTLPAAMATLITSLYYSKQLLPGRPSGGLIRERSSRFALSVFYFNCFFFSLLFRVWPATSSPIPHSRLFRGSLSAA